MDVLGLSLQKKDCVRLAEVLKKNLDWMAKATN